MSTSSANATALPSNRRGFLASIAAASALGLPASPAFTDGPGPIEALYAEHLRIEIACNAASIAAMDAEELYEEPERPRWRAMHSSGNFVKQHLPDGRLSLVLDDSQQNIAALKAAAAEVHDPETNSLGHCAAERARETLAELETWQAEVRRRKDACGLTAAEEAEARGWAVSSASQEAIFAVEASTFRDLACQAAILGVDWHQARGERVLARLVELAGVTPFARA